MNVSHAMKECAAVAENFANTLRRAGLNISDIRDLQLPSPQQANHKRKLSEVEAGEEKTKGKRGPKPKKEKKEKDPLEPRRPASSFLMFQNFLRAELKKKNSEVSSDEIKALTKTSWDQLGDSEKQVRLSHF
jgi:transcriptional regulator HMO1